MTKGITRWSESIEGERTNYEWPAQFSVTDGFVTIYQKKHDGTQSCTEAVLLSPKQFQALVRFATGRRRKVGAQ